MNFIASAASATTLVMGIVALLIVGLGVFWLFNKRARLRHIAELRKKLDELRPTDPEYGAARALYTSMVIDAQRWGFFSSSDGPAGPGGTDHHSGGHSGDGGGDGH